MSDQRTEQALRYVELANRVTLRMQHKHRALGAAIIVLAGLYETYGPKMGGSHE